MMDPIPGVPVFSWCHSPDAVGDIVQRVLVAQFGDGYSQRAEDGVNTNVEKWPLQFTGPVDRIAEIRAFLDERKGARAFHWRPPLGVLGLYYATGYSLRPINTTGATLAVTFTQTFRA